MLRLGLRLTVSLAAILALTFLALSPGHKTSASIDLTGSWATVYSEVLPAPQVNLGDCKVTLVLIGPGHYGAAPGRSCESNGMTTTTPGAAGFDLTLSGLNFTGTGLNTGPPCCYVTSFTGTGSPDLDSANGTWWATFGVVAGPCCGFASGTFVSARAQPTTGTAGQTITYPNVGNGASLTFGGSNTGGNTSIVSAATADANLPAGFYLVGQYYHVITTVPHGPPGPYIFCAGYPDSNNDGYVDGTGTPGIDETTLTIAHYEPPPTGPTGWVDKARYDGLPIPPGSDTAANTVCASVDHLSQFALVSTAGPVGGLVDIVGGNSSSGVSSWLWALSIAGVAIALATAGGWLALERRRMH